MKELLIILGVLLVAIATLIIRFFTEMDKRTYSNIELEGTVSNTEQGAMKMSEVIDENKNKLIRCPDCGKDVSYRVSSCPHCGAPVEVGKGIISTKRILPVILICFFFAVLGLHRFYVGKTMTGFLMPILFILGFFTFGIGWIILVIWYIVDFVMIVSGAFKDSHGLLIKKWT